MLSSYSCEPKSLEKTFNSEPNFDFDPIPLDGILFYHKRVNYLPGVTPLVGWLKGYMLPEMLNVQVRSPTWIIHEKSYVSSIKKNMIVNVKQFF